MEHWVNEFFVMMQAVTNAFADEIEKFVADVTKDMEEAVDALVQASGEWLEQLETSIVADLEYSIDDFFDPILEAYLGFEVSVGQTVQPVINAVEPLLNEHPVCVGCRHYHGQAYNDVMFVCGMHPYGWEGEKCPDWESF